jgi:hypothetical protein
MSFRAIFSFPLAINEKAARTVAAVVAMTALVALATGWLWLAIPLMYGFWARVLTGPTLSPLGRFASSFFAPRYLGTPKWVPGPPKRFAQAMGAGFTTGATIAWAVGDDTVAIVLLALLVVAATLESVFALCLGCKVFAGLMRVGLVPQSVCEACAPEAVRAG